MTVFKWVRFVRQLTQEDLELKTGITQGRISKIERGYAQPSKDEHIRLAKALDIDPSELEFPLRDG